MQLLGRVPQCEINSIATNPSAAPTSFVTCGSDGRVRYWDTRLKKKDVLTFAVPNVLGDTDLMEIVWATDATKAHTLAGSVLSCVDVRKAEVVAQHFYSNTFKIKAGSEETRTIPVALASFDARLKQHSMCASDRIRNDGSAIPLCDDNGEVYLADPTGCYPLNSSLSASGSASKTYNGLLRPKAMDTVSCGFTSSLLSATYRSTLVCGMDNKLLCYQQNDTAAVPIKGSKLANTLSMEGLGNENEGAEATSSLSPPTNNTTSQRKDIENPPVPACLAPLTAGDMSLVAIGRGDGSYVIIDVMPTVEEEGKEVEEETNQANIGLPEVAFVAQGHANNTIGTCLWVPPALVGSEGIVAEYKGTNTRTPKVLITIPTSGEVTMWDVTGSVVPMDEEIDDVDKLEDNDGTPPALFASNVRGPSLAGPRSMVNCGALLASGKGFLVGTSNGEVLMEMFE